MKKQIGGSIFMTVCALNAHAQSNVTFYGNADAAIMYQNTSAAAQAHSFSFAGAGGHGGNFWGITGTEDVGGDVHIGFQLESQFSLGTGEVYSTINQFFRRAANISVSSQLGKVTLGVQLDPAYLSNALTDPRNGYLAYSGLAAWYPAVGLSGPTQTGLYDSNAVSYSIAFGGMRITALYGLGGVAGSTVAGRVLSVGAQYSNGPLLLTGGYFTHNSTGVTDQGGSTLVSEGARDARAWVVGAAYQLGPVSIKGNFTDFQVGAHVNPLVPNSAHVQAISAGVNWAITPQVFTTLAYYDFNNKTASNDATRTVVLGLDYYLSKRTSLYVQGALMHAKSGASALTNLLSAGNSPSVLVGGAPASNTISAGVGIVHSF
jgi:predicted porin